MDPYTAALTTAATAIAQAVAEDLKMDRFLAEQDPEYAEVLIAERIDRKQFWLPLLDLLKELKP